jgi:hypothetical protein
MGFGNFLKGVVAQANPFDRGKTYGSYNPPKKKLQPGDYGYVAPTAAPKAPQSQNPLAVQQPQNHFDTGITQLTLPGAPKPTVNPLGANTNLAPLIKPVPGQVIKPTTTLQPAQPKPANQPQNGYQQAPGVTGTRGTKNGENGVFATNAKTGKTNFVPDAPKPQDNRFWQKVGRGFKTAGQTAVGTVANVPEVALAAGRAGTGIVQGVTQLPHVVTAITATGTQKLNNAVDNRFTHALNTGAQGANTGVNAVTKQVDRPFGVINRGLDRAAQGYENHVPGATGGAKVYKYEQIPLNVLAGLLTLGGSTAAGEAGQAGRLGEAGEAGKSGLITRLLNKPLMTNEDNAVARTAQAISSKTRPVVQSLNAPFSSSKNAITKFIGNNRNLENEAIDAGEAGNILSEAGQPGVTQIPVGTGIDVNAPPGEPISVPVKVNTPTPTQGPIIREIGGDAPNVTRVPTPDEVAAQRAADRFSAQPAPRPDTSIEGVTPREPTAPFKLNDTAVKGTQDEAIQGYAAMLKDLGEGNGVDLVPDGEPYGYGKKRVSNNVRFGDTKGKRMTKQDWLDEAERQLRAGRGEPGAQRAFDDASNPEVQSMLNKGDQTPAPEGKPIAVKEVKGIPVTDQTVVPTDLPETPGTVRPTAATAPMEAKSAAAASTPVVNTPPSLPKDVQNILDNPKQFNKRQVAAARNQRKLARQMAKTQEDTADAMDRIKTASPVATSGEGFVPTGEFGKSVNGGPIQNVNRAAEMQQAVQETSQMSPGDVLKTARDNQRETGGFNRRDIRNVAALFETKRLPRGSSEWNEARQILKEDGTVWGQTGVLRNYTMRRTASADELMGRYESKIYRLADDPSKIDGKLFDDVEAAENSYTEARDAASKAYNDFTESPTSANAKAYHAAQDAADKADKNAKITEYKVADKALKGNKDVKQVRELEKMANDADLYQMDAVDASMLSGTGTFVRNVVNAATSGAEEGLFGKIGAKISSKLTGEVVGGGVGRKSVSGFLEGAHNVVDASKARAGNAGKNPLSHIKNYATTGNQMGDTFIDSQVAHNTLDHYTQVLKDQGFKGSELKNRASVMARQDPDDIAKMYQGAARTAAGLGSGITRNNKIETVVKNMISDAISGGNPNKVSEGIAKLTTRMTIGFPTAIGRSTVEGVKRFTLGAPTFVKALATKDPQARALLIKEGIKQAGTGGLVLPPLFYALGQSGAITGAYPSDPEERARWEREGISENSVKIGGSYYQLPAYLGAWAVPGLFYASLGRNNGDFKAAAADTAKIVPSLLPTEQAGNIQDVIDGRTDVGKFMSQSGAAAVRAATPAGALLNQIAKSLDSTKNDTTGGTNWENFVNRVVGGIPGQNKFADIPDAVDDAGNPIKNPGAVPLAFGASSAEQGAGEARTADLKAQVTSQAKALQGTGALDDPNLKGVLDDKNLQLYNKLTSGKDLSQKEMNSLQDALVKGVSASDDTAYLEREQYDTNLAALKLKRQLMSADKTTKPSDIAKMDAQIKRGQVYKDNNVPYDLITAYKGTSLSDWRAMGDPESDSYDPDTYQKLWDMDEMMTKAGVSDKTGDMTKNKFSAKESKAGGKGSRGGYSSDFGKLTAGDFAPKVQQYQTMDQSSGVVPHISVVRPNIVHKIGSSG